VFYVRLNDTHVRMMWIRMAMLETDNNINRQYTSSSKIAQPKIKMSRNET